jgi:hypothetical protein
MDRTAAMTANSAAIVLNLDCRLTARARGISVMLAFSGIAGTRISADISQNAAATKAAKAPKALTLQGCHLAPPVLLLARVGAVRARARPILSPLCALDLPRLPRLFALDRLLLRVSPEGAQTNFHEHLR